MFIALITLLVAGCDKLAVAFAPAKKPILADTPLATQAKRQFWMTLHQGHYDRLPETTELLTAAYLQYPNDPELAAYLGFAHIWWISERQRLTQLPPNIVNHIILAHKYFADAHELAPNDARILGFYGVSQLVEGKLFANQREQTKGYLTLKRAIHAWPQFNYFTASYPLSTLPRDDKLFRQALAWQWRTLDICAGKKVDRRNPDYTPYMHLQTTQGTSRACWNSWIAPHNFEGFFLNMGDMLVKQGDWQTAIKIYNNAKLSPHYSQWPYKDILQTRITNAKTNVEKFNQSTPLTAMPPRPTIMFNSRFSCMACHQE
ncbi:MAG: hypothetical protein HWD59_07665 [Coxiellaceae bacterium]|nr:MAG: hypothetical protein HWD59_07665 [Coxiellaceae bacterium]